MLNMNNPQAKYEISWSYLYLNIMFTMFWPFDLFWPQMTFGLHQKQYGSSTQHKYSTCWAWDPPQVLFLNYSVYKVLTIWLHDDLKWTLTLIKNDRDHLLNVGNVHAEYEIPHSDPYWDIVFTTFWPFDLCWPQMTFDLHQN